MPRTIVVPQTILRAATTLALAALTASTALAAPSMYSQNSAQEAPTVTGINGIGGENDTQIPDSITKEHWAYQFIHNVENHTLRVWSCGLAMPVPYGSG